MSVRVLRLMEYTYEDAEQMVDDMNHWKVQGTFSPRIGMTIKSTTLSPMLLEGTELQMNATPPEAWDRP